MKKNKRAYGKWVLFVIMLILLLPLVTGNRYLYKAIIYNFAGIDDYEIFDNNTVTTTAAIPWQQSEKYTNTLPDTLSGYLAKLKTIGLLVVQNRKIAVEKYWDDYSDSSFFGIVFSCQKHYLLLIGAAIHDGKISSVNDAVGKYLPEFAQGEKAKVKIIDLLTMSSGSDWDESYANPFSMTTRLYYGNDAYKTATSVNIVKTPGTLHDYKSGDTQLLGLIVEKATGKSLSQYAAEKLWKPLGAGASCVMEHR